MKKILIGLLIIILGLGSINVYKRLTESSDQKVKFYVYNQRTGKLVDRIFRTIPTTYDTMIDIEIVEPFSKELNLYRVNLDIYGGQPDLHYIVYDKDNREISELMSDFLVKDIENIESIDYDTIFASFIDIDVFRQVFEPRIKTSEGVADKYAELLASSLDNLNFKKINNEFDIESIQKFHRKTHSPMIDEEKTILDFSFFNRLADNEFIYWFYDYGLVKIQVIMDNGELSKVKTTRLGNLGVEITHL